MIRITAWIVLVTFVLGNSSCVHHTTRTESFSELGSEDTEILAVYTIDGEFITFAEGYPGHVRGDVIEGYVLDPVEVKLAKTEIKRNIRDAKGRTVSIGTKDGHKYWLERITSDSADSLAFMSLSRTPVSVPSVDVETVLVKRVSMAPTFIGIVGGVLLLSILAVALVSGGIEDIMGGALGGA